MTERKKGNYIHRWCLENPKEYENKEKEQAVLLRSQNAR